jgi:spore coat polysaccharide biosynthesis predicted glycosyltransferase SpsG
MSPSSKKTSFGNLILKGNKSDIVITDAIGLESKQLKTINDTEDLTFIIPKAEQQNNVSIDSVFIRQTLDNFYELGVQVSIYGENNQPISMGLYLSLIHI